MRVDSREQRIYVRQSWIGDYLICPERARLGVELKSFRTGSDATAIGTGVHAAIEWALNAHSELEQVNPEAMSGYAQQQVALELEKPVKRTRISDKPETIATSVDAMVNSWIETIAPNVEWGGSTELGFRFPSGSTASNGYEIWYEGTIDYVTPNGVIWDWKTASRPYNGREKQEKAHQPTVYCMFQHHREGHAYQLFRYGVMVRQQTPKAQVVEIGRDQRHYNWLNRQVESIVNNCLRSGHTSSWPMNDTSALCSSTWCDYWSVCKGAHLPS
jgi:hypothetical protein